MSLPTQRPPASSPKPTAAKPPSDGDFDQEAENLVHVIREAARAAGLEPNDPMMPIIVAFERQIRFMAERTRRSDRLIVAASASINAALLEARRTADAEVRRFSASVLETEAKIIPRIAASIATSADNALTRRVKVFDRNTAMWAAAALFATSISCGIGGYVWGENSARANIHETEVALRAAFSNSPDDANGWMLLMNWNDLIKSWNNCLNPKLEYVIHGRRACAMPLWIEKPQSVGFEEEH